MRQAVASQRTVACQAACIDELHSSAARRVRRHHDRHIEVDQAAVVHAGSLAAVDAVRVVADAARRSQVHDVPAVQREAFVIENAFTPVTTVAQRVSLRALRRKVIGIVVSHEQRFKDRAVRAVSAGSAT